MTSVTHGGSEIKRSQKESTFYYYNISWGLNISADLGLSNDWVWCLIACGSKKPEFRSSPGTGSLPHCELALAGFSPSPKCINLFSRGWMAPALGLAVYIQAPIHTALLTSQATCACGKLYLHLKSREVKEDTHWLQQGSIQAQTSSITQKLRVLTVHTDRDSAMCFFVVTILLFIIIITITSV